MSLQTDLHNAVTQVATDSALLHAVVHGNANTTVTTDGGVVRSLARLIADKDAEINQAADGVLAQAAGHAASATLGAAEAASFAAEATTSAAHAAASERAAANSRDAAVDSKAQAALSEASAAASRDEAAQSVIDIQSMAQIVAQAAAIEAVTTVGTLTSIKRRTRQLHLLNLFY